jgi:glucose-6-phosphate 1-dehydrogenase
MSKPLSSDALVFFGATGDLAYKQIFPALQAMVRKGALNVPIIGVAKSGWTLEQLRERVRSSLENHGGIDREAYDRLITHLRYVDGDYGDERTFQTLRKELGSAQRPLYYLAVPPSTFSTVIEGLSKAGIAENARVAIEKPFGHDLASARSLNETIHHVFPESSVFRIDHYLGKEPVLSLLYFRFSNILSEAVLNRDYVDHIEITMAEHFGVQGRGKFYEETGAIRDVIQNHVLQLTAILAMDAPVGHDIESIRDEKARVLKAIAPLDPKQIVRGQFKGYRDEPGVAKSSTVETYAAAQLEVDSSRWAGVPFLIRAGKALAANAFEIRVQFKRPIRDIYPESGLPCEYMRFRIGPDVTIHALGMRVKKPGEAMLGEEVELLASESQAHDLLPYERLLGDAFKGDANLFARQDSIEQQWRIVDPVLNMSTAPSIYEPGSWGPPEADRIAAEIGSEWVEPIPPLGETKQAA